MPSGIRPEAIVSREADQGKRKAEDLPGLGSKSFAHYRFGIASTLAAAVAQASASVAPVPRWFTPSDSVR